MNTSKTTKSAPKTTKSAPKTSTKNKKTAAKPAAKAKGAKSTLTPAAVSTPKTSASVKTVPVAAVMGAMIDTQEIANRLGRNWQFVNRQRHAGNFIDHAAVLKAGGTYLYKVSAVRAWAKQNGYPFSSN